MPLTAQAAWAQSHTIVLVQTTASRATRTFHDYEGVGSAMDGARTRQQHPSAPPRPRRCSARALLPSLNRALALAGVCAMYEQKLKAQNPSHRNITYDISDLFFFIDSLGDLSCLGALRPTIAGCRNPHRGLPAPAPALVAVFNDQLGAYQPYGKEWVKQRVFARLKQQIDGQ